MNDGAPAAAEAEALPATDAKRRPPALTLLLLAIAALNVAGEVKGLSLRGELLRDFPRMSPALFNLWTVAPPLTVLGCVGLWFLRRWGLWLISLAWALVMVVDLWVGATTHAMLATAAMWLVVIAVRPVRTALK